MATKVMPKAITQADSDLARLGVGAYASKVSPTHVDLSMPPATPVLATISAEPQNFTIDLKRSAMIVVDMQNDFCAPGSWVNRLGADLSRGRAPTSHRQRLLPAPRTTGVPIIWLNSGNRADRKNLRPTTLYVFNRDGIGIGGELPRNGAHLPEQDGWSAAVVDELLQPLEDIKVDKYRISGCWDTALDSILKQTLIRNSYPSNERLSPHRKNAAA
jgi:ureidoacrylate peracid hydrolase